MSSDAEKMYQFGETLRRLENNSINQIKILENVNQGLANIGTALNKLSDVKDEQTRQKVILETLAKESEENKKFIKKCRCEKHSIEIKALKRQLDLNRQTDDRQNKNAVTLAIGFFLAVITGIATWLATNK